MPETKVAKSDLAHPLLSVRNLSVRFGESSAQVEAVSDVSFDVARSSTVGVVGESGSGKSVTSHAITRLFPKSAKAAIGGAIEFRGRDEGHIDKRKTEADRKERGERNLPAFNFCAERERQDHVWSMAARRKLAVMALKFELRIRSQLVANVHKRMMKAGTPVNDDILQNVVREEAIRLGGTGFLLLENSARR